MDTARESVKKLLDVASKVELEIRLAHEVRNTPLHGEFLSAIREVKAWLNDEKEE